MNEEAKYIRCKIKNIAILNKMHMVVSYYSYLEVIDKLPRDCIRLNSTVGWCYTSCDDAVCRECEEIE